MFFKVVNMFILFLEKHLYCERQRLHDLPVHPNARQCLHADQWLGDQGLQPSAAQISGHAAREPETNRRKVPPHVGKLDFYRRFNAFEPETCRIRQMIIRLASNFILYSFVLICIDVYWFVDLSTFRISDEIPGSQQVLMVPVMAVLYPGRRPWSGVARLHHWANAFDCGCLDPPWIPSRTHRCEPNMKQRIVG